MKIHPLHSVLLFGLILLSSVAAAAQTGTPNLILAEKARDVEDWDTAITYFTKSIEAGEGKGNVMIAAVTYAHRCQAYFNKDKFDLAIADCDKAIEIKPDLGYVYHLRASSLRRTGKIERAIADFTHAIQLTPDSPHSYVGRAIAYSDNGNKDQAIVDYGKAIELDPNDADTYFGRAMLFRQKGDFDQALTDFQAGLKLDPNVLEGHIGLGLCYQKKRDYDRALNSFNAALKLYPRSTDALLFRGVSYAEQAEYDLAIRDYSEALRLNPGFVLAYPIRGDAYVKKGEYARAVADYSKRLELEPSSTTLYARGWANLYANDGRAAFADAQKYLELNGLKKSGPYAVLVGYLGLRKANRSAEAKAFVANSVKQMDGDEWAGKIMLYLQGLLSAKQLLELSTDNDKLTESHAYIGIIELFDKDEASARVHFTWVKEKGNKSFAEYNLALAELGRLPRTTQ